MAAFCLRTASHSSTCPSTGESFSFVVAHSDPHPYSASSDALSDEDTRELDAVLKVPNASGLGDRVGEDDRAGEGEREGDDGGGVSDES